MQHPTVPRHFDKKTARSTRFHSVQEPMPALLRGARTACSTEDDPNEEEKAPIVDLKKNVHRSNFVRHVSSNWAATMKVPLCRRHRPATLVLPPLPAPSHSPLNDPPAFPSPVSEGRGKHHPAFLGRKAFLAATSRCSLMPRPKERMRKEKNK